MLKVNPPPDYPPEEGCYIRGNDRSPVAVCIILRWDQDKVPPEIEELVRVGVEGGPHYRHVADGKHWPRKDNL